MDDDSDQLKQQTAIKFATLACESFQEQNLPDAFFHFVNCFKVWPYLRNDDQYKIMFFNVLTRLGNILESTENHTELWSIYKAALELYQDNAEVLHNLGAHLLRLGIPERAIFFFSESLRNDNCYIPAFQSLQSAFCYTIKRWHYRMLNDKYRNEAFKKSICKRISAGFDTVLDIGTGTGLFCLYAEEGGAQRIYGCEYNQIMVNIANEVCARRSPSSIRLIPKHSNDILIPDDMPEKVSLVVTETMDVCILGEHILDTLIYAWKNLLHPGGIVIPQSGSLKFRIVQSRQLVKDYLHPFTETKTNDIADIFANVSLKDNCWSPEGFRDLMLDVALRSCTNEPYDAERLQLYGDCRVLTSECTAFDIDFNSLTQIESFLSQNKREFRIPCAADGYGHAIVAWFEVNLDDEITLRSAPYGENSKYCCWDQAIFPCPKAFRVCKDSWITVVNEVPVDGRMKFDIRNVVDKEGRVLSNDDLLPKSISAACISMLNDYTLISCLKFAAIEFLNGHTRSNKVQILDLFPVPIFGLTVLRNTHMIPRHLEKVELTCVVTNAADAEAVTLIAHNNGIPASCLSFVHAEQFEQEIMIPKFGGYFDAIAVNVVKSNGLLDEGVISNVDCLKVLLTQEGIILPKKVKIEGQLIHSDYLERGMRVVNEDLIECGIAPMINEYQVSQILEINETRLPYKAYSCPFTCAVFKLDELDSKHRNSISVSAIRRGEVNSILMYYRIQFTRANMEYCTYNELASVSQSAFLMRNALSVDVDCEVVLNIVYHHGAFRVDLPD